MRLVECVPNFSEGRDKAKVSAIVAAVRSAPGVRVLDVETDPDHNRCVLSFVAPVEGAVEAAFRGARRAVELIDLNVHKGEHPRMGAVDVIPFIPAAGTTIADCVALASALGERIGSELGVPVYLYDRAARRPERADLAKVRKGQFEGLREALGKDPGRAPDFGPGRIHPTAGAVAVGAREQIINFNLNLKGVSMDAAKAIARRIRTSGGGLPNLRAKEIALTAPAAGLGAAGTARAENDPRAAQGLVQVSTVLTDHGATSLAAVLDAVSAQAEAAGGEVVGTEIVGLLPRKALLDFAAERLRVKGFDPSVQVLEERLESLERGWESSAVRVADAFASEDPTPGGGSAAGVSGAIACALGEMACGVSLGGKKAEGAGRAALAAAAAAFRAARGRMHELTSEDAAAFDAFMATLKLPKDDPARPGRMRDALVRAGEVPLETARASLAALGMVREAAPLAAGTVASDMNCAAHLLRAAALCALENVRINADSLKDAEAADRLREAAAAVEAELAGIGSC